VTDRDAAIRFIAMVLSGTIVEAGLQNDMDPTNVAFATRPQ